MVLRRGTHSVLFGTRSERTEFCDHVKYVFPRSQKTQMWPNFVSSPNTLTYMDQKVSSFLM